MAYSKGWFVAFFLSTATSGKASGHLFRNPNSSSDVYDFQDVTKTENDTILSDRFQNHDGGVTDSPSGFLCLDVVRLVSSYSIQKKKEDTHRYVCHYKRQGVIMSGKLSDENSNFDKHFRRDSRLFLKGATYDRLTNTIQITPEVDFIWFTSTVQQSLRSRSIGTKTVLVFRVTARGVAPSYTAADMSNWVFGTSGDKITMKSQFEKCSYGQLKFIPAVGENIVDGVVEVVSRTKYDDKQMKEDAKEYARNRLRVPVDSFDHLMFVVPHTAGMYSYVEASPGKESIYINYFESNHLHMCGIGFNLGLDYAHDHGNLDSEFSDETSVMTPLYSSEDREMCFNAAQMSHLGWYKSRERYIDTRIENFSGKIIGVNDYGVSTEEHILVLEIDSSEDRYGYYYYLTLNRAEGIVKDVPVYQNQIIVTTANFDWAYEHGQTAATSLLSEIKEGSFERYPNWYGSRDLIISFTSTGVDGEVNFANVEVYLVDDVASN